MYTRGHHIAILNQTCDEEVRTIFEMRMSQVVKQPVVFHGHPGVGM
jgi:hypothetical protein